jgi:hypothetical protein
VNNSPDNGLLLAALRAAVEARAAVPDSFVEAGKNAYAWRTIDAELASLAYDSRLDAGRSAAVRAEAASVRALTFQSARFSIEVEVTDDGLFGQLVPPGPGTAEIQLRSGHNMTAPVDDVGCFSFELRPAGPFRLRCRTETQADVLTGWVTLLPPGSSPHSVSRRGR